MGTANHCGDDEHRLIHTPVTSWQSLGHCDDERWVRFDKNLTNIFLLLVLNVNQSEKSGAKAATFQVTTLWNSTTLDWHWIQSWNQNVQATVSKFTAWATTTQ